MILINWRSRIGKVRMWMLHAGWDVICACVHRRVTNHINMLADISGFSCHFGAKFQISLRYANLLITVRT